MKRLFLSIPLFLLVLVACQSEKKAVDTKSAEQVDLDEVAGTYVGVLPCDDCKGVKTEIELLPDGKFRLFQSYLNQDYDVARHGEYEFNANEKIVKLHPDDEEAAHHQYKITENGLEKLDKRGRVYKDEIRKSYQLKQDMRKPAFINRYWKLSEINGEPVKQPEFSLQTAYLFFEMDEMRVSGNTGCNSLGGDFKLEDTNGLNFVNLITTKKACVDIPWETDYLKALRSVDHYKLDEDRLVLYSDANEQSLLFVEMEKPLD